MNDMATQNKSDILNYEMAFSNATKSSRLQALQDQLNRQRDKHMENIKTSLRNFRSKFDSFWKNFFNFLCKSFQS